MTAAMKKHARPKKPLNSKAKAPKTQKIKKTMRRRPTKWSFSRKRPNANSRSNRTNRTTSIITMAKTAYWEMQLNWIRSSNIDSPRNPPKSSQSSNGANLKSGSNSIRIRCRSSCLITLRKTIGCSSRNCLIWFKCSHHRLNSWSCTYQRVQPMWTSISRRKSRI